MSFYRAAPSNIRLLCGVLKATRVHWQRCRLSPLRHTGLQRRALLSDVARRQRAATGRHCVATNATSTLVIPGGQGGRAAIGCHSDPGSAMHFQGPVRPSPARLGWHPGPAAQTSIRLGCVRSAPPMGRRRDVPGGARRAHGETRGGLAATPHPATTAREPRAEDSGEFLLAPTGYYTPDHNREVTSIFQSERPGCTYCRRELAFLVPAGAAGNTSLTGTPRKRVFPLGRCGTVLQHQQAGYGGARRGTRGGEPVPFYGPAAAGLRRAAQGPGR